MVTFSILRPMFVWLRYHAADLATAVPPNSCPHQPLDLRVHSGIEALWDHFHEGEGEERGQGMVLVTARRIHIQLRMRAVSGSQVFAMGRDVLQHAWEKRARKGRQATVKMVSGPLLVLYLEEVLYGLLWPWRGLF